MDINTLNVGTKKLLESVGEQSNFSICQLQGGGNNRVFKITTERRSYFLKEYFHHQEDNRDRLHAEFGFCRYARNFCGLRVPEAYATDDINRIGLFEFIDGRPMEDSELEPARICELCDFFTALNKNRFTEEGMRLPIGSESFFSLSGHLSIIDTRLNTLNGIEENTTIDKEAKAFIREDLAQSWIRVRENTEALARKMDLDLTEEISQEEKVISPSDFGFHNTVITNDQRLHFVDFEYSGWDDPAKMFCDLFCQVAFPIPLSNFERTTERIFPSLTHTEKLRQRILLLFPVFQLKWCCIVLNHFLQTGFSRRNFAGETSREMVETKKEIQLGKARKLLRDLSEKEQLLNL